MNRKINDSSSVDFVPRISPAIWRLRPDFVALSIVAQGCANAAPMPWVEERLADAREASLTGPAWADAHRGSWQDAFRVFGAKPQRTPCSAEALRKRAVRGDVLARINAVVDLYNAISVAYAVPVGGEDMSRYSGLPMLTIAKGDEAFETTKEGAPSVEQPEPGEVIWRDDRGVTCRRWNWRQGPRTRITEQTRRAWFVLERLDPMPIDALHRAAEDLSRDIRRLAPDVRITKRLFQKDTEQPLI